LEFLFLFDWRKKGVEVKLGRTGDRHGSGTPETRSRLKK
jgi:hypothetical protein